MNNRRTLLIVWKWSHGHGFLNENDMDVWRTEKDDVLITADWRKEDFGAKFENIRAKCATIPWLVLLHEGHYYKASEVVPFQSEDVKIRLFGGGKDPIYFSDQHRFGLLGAAGNWANWILLEGKMQRSTAIVDMEHKIINQSHFDFVWDHYDPAPLTDTDDSQEAVWAKFWNGHDDGGFNNYYTYARWAADVAKRSLSNGGNSLDWANELLSPKHSKDFEHTFEYWEYYMPLLTKFSFGKEIEEVNGHLSKAKQNWGNLKATKDAQAHVLPIHEAFKNVDQKLEQISKHIKHKP